MRFWNNFHLVTLNIEILNVYILEVSFVYKTDNSVSQTI